MVGGLIISVFAGFFAKLITGIDDTLTHAPLVAHTTKTRVGRYAFGLGMFGALTVILAFSSVIAKFLAKIPARNFVMSILLFALAAGIYFNFLKYIPHIKTKRKLHENSKISETRFFKLIGLGFFTFFITGVDDVIAYSSLFMGNILQGSFVIFGILAAGIIEIILVITAAKFLSKLKYKNEIAGIGLSVLAVLVLFGVV